MKAYRLMLAMLVLLVSTGMRAQYNPTNPDEPDTPVTPEPEYTLTLLTAPTGLGSPFSLNATSKHKAGEVITNLRANSVQNYTFEQWTEGDAVVATTAVIASYTMPDHDVTLVAHYRFTPGNPDNPDAPVLPVYSTVTTSANPAAGGTVSGGGRYQVGTAVALKATANQYYKFRDWTKNGQVLSTQPSFTYTVEEGNPHIVANFISDYHPDNPNEPDEPEPYVESKPLYWLHIAVSPAEGGYTTPKDSIQVREGEKQQLQAMNNPWYTFLRWADGSGSVVSTNSSLSYTMPGHDVWLTAHYDYTPPAGPDEPGEVTGKLHIYALSQTGRGGQTIFFPIYLENPQPVQFMSVDVQLPDDFSVDATQAVLTARSTGHELSVSSLGNNTYRLLLLGSTGFTGTGGKVLELPVSLPTEAESTTSYVVRLTNGAADGQSVPTRNGFIYVERQREDGLYAGFSFDQLCDRVRFTNHSSQNVRSLQWDFGDGTTSTEASPLHVYQLPGTYTVSLTVQGQTDTDVAQQTILVNEAATWCTEGIYYLSPTRQDVRSFSDIDELFSFIARSPVSGDVTISLESGQTFTYLLSDEHQSLLNTLCQMLGSSGHLLTLSGGGTIDFRGSGSGISREAIASVVALGQYMRIDSGTRLLLWGIPVNVAALYTPNGQTVASGEQTQAEDFGAISPQLSYRWTLTTPFDGVPAEGSGVLPSFTVDNSTGRPVTLTYHVTASHQDTELMELDYTVTVLPSTMAPDLTLRNITLAKTSLQPGDELTLTWQVVNAGGTDFTGGWRENISVVNTQDTCLLTTVYATETSLAAGASKQRSARVTVPAQPGLSGSVQLLIDIIPASDANEPAKNLQNNSTMSQSLTLAARLDMVLTPQNVTETAGTPQHLRAQLLRSGSRQQNETFRISVQGDSRVTADQIVLIPKRQAGSFLNIYVGNNEEQDRDSVFFITAIPEATESAYSSATMRLVVEDDEHPPLTLRASKTDVTEGETFQLTVTVAEAMMQPLSVSLTAEHPMRFTLPAMLTIPAGQTTATVDVVAVDDDVPQTDLTTSFIAYAEGYERAETLVMLHDNDLPVLELELTPSQVKEDDGPVSVSGTLRRTTNLGSKITVQLSDDSNGGLYLGQTTLELAKGVNEVHFNLGPVDNNQVDGDRTYTVMAAVWLSSCSCSAKGQAAGSVEARITVYDNDGPSLSLTSPGTALKEGNKLTLTVSRNTTDNSGPLTVTLVSSGDEMLDYNHHVTIPAGQSSATVEVTTMTNDVEGDSQTIMFTAEAEAFSSGVCWLMLTDQTLPDARITAFTANKDEEVADGSMTLTVTVSNDGAAPLSDATPVSIYRRGGSTPVAMVYTQMTLEPGEKETLTRDISLPATTGMQAYYAVVNEGGRFRELSTLNNTSPEVRIRIMSPFTATVHTDKALCQQGEAVTIIGQLTGNQIALAEAELYIIGNGVRQTFNVTTDAEGSFNYEWQPYQLQMGHYAIGVCYPSEQLTEAMATVDIYGLRRQGTGYITCDVTENEPYEGSITIENPGTLPLTGVKAEVLTAPDGCDVKVNMPTRISGRQEVRLSYTLTGSTPTIDNAWEKIILKVTTNEGASLEQTLYYYCRPARAQLVVSESSINTTMTKGSTRDYLLYITNFGRGSTGNITLSLPSWMQSATGTTLAPLAQNDTATIILRLQPTDDMQLNVPVTGHLGINCQNGNGVQVDFNITPVSDSKGTLVVDVCDENTYYSDGSPHVQGAEVVVRNPITQALIAQGTTGSNGLFTQQLPEGWYQLSVTANGHDAYQNNILVDPEAETHKVINLSVNGITVDFGVKETEVEDEYEIVNNLSYETNVPVPVVVLEVPKRIAADSLQAGESLIFYAKLTNVGLIKTEDVSLLLPTGFTHLMFEALADCQGITLGAGQSVTIPVKVTRVNVAASRPLRDKNIDNDPCVAQPGTLYYWDCGYDRKWHRYGIAMQVGACNSNDPSTWNPVMNPNDSVGEWTGGWPSGAGITSPPNLPGTGGGNGYVSSASDKKREPVIEDKGCEPCQNGKLNAGLRCAANFAGDAKDTIMEILDLVFKYEEEKEKSPDEKNPFDENLESAENSLERLIEILERSKIVEQQLITDLKEALSNLKGFKGLVHLVGRGYEVFEDCSKLLKQRNFDTVYDCYKSLSSFIDGLFNEALTTTAGKFVSEKQMEKYIGIGKKLLKWKKVADNVMECAHGFVHACDYLKDSIDVASVRAMTNGELSYLDNYNQALDNFCHMLKAYQGVEEILWGPEEQWKDVSMLEMDILQALDYSKPTSMLMAYRPEALPSAVFMDYLNRRKAFESDGFNQATIQMLDSLLSEIHSCSLLFEDSSLTDYVVTEFKNVTQQLTGAANSVCARISLTLPQTLHLTRQAFRGTLTVYNGHEDTPMQDVRLTLIVSDGSTVATAHKFQINAESLQGFAGDLDLTAGWTLDAQQTGTATILFIPTQFAAPTDQKQWSFGGVLSYIDPFTNQEVRRELYPVTLTVSPSPLLDLDYFIQRNIYGDDPLTKDTVEAMVPAEFALIINNKGAGEALSVRMTTRQPQIVDNEKGLAVNFSIIGSSLNGQPANMTMSDSYATDFGTIPAHSQTYAQWWLQSTLLGHFTNYDVTVNHLTSYGNPDLSLIDQARVHELIHGFTVGDGRRGFLVNDLPDAYDQPDAIYFTDASQTEVGIVNDAYISKEAGGYLLRMNADSLGWYYGSLPDPTDGKLVLTDVVRQQDGVKLPADNLWQTNRTMRDGQDWLYENRLHFIAQLPDGGESYLLAFQAPEVVGVKAMVQSDDLQIQLSPLPIGSWLSINGNFSEVHSFALYDMQGMKRLELAGLWPGQNVYTGSLPVGIYYAIVNTDKGIHRTKVLKR